jgi:hypothetical protein
MEQKEFYEVNGCEWFIPVKLIEIEEDKYTKRLEVEAIESGRRTFVPSMYKFERVEKPEKVVVPKFVVEWIEYYKKKGRKLYYALNHIHHDDELKLYINKQEGDYTETFARAWLAYPNITVEKEKLYTVEIPNPNLNAHVVLQKTEKGVVLVTVGNARWKGWESSKLTEAEIRKDFDWAWQWAKPVEVE